VLPGGKRSTSVVSLVDLFPTLCEICRAETLIDKQASLDGDSFVDLLNGSVTTGKDEAILEYCGEGVLEPMRMLRKGQYKYVYVHDQPSLLFDLKEDPSETVNLSGSSQVDSLERMLNDRILEGWEPGVIKQDILQSQQTRIILNSALSKGATYSWDFDPRLDPAKQYVRSNSQVENLKARFPR
jgi:choline-sulfatase